MYKVIKKYYRIVFIFMIICFSKGEMIALTNDNWYVSNIPFSKSFNELKGKYEFEEFSIPVIGENFKMFDLKNKIKVYSVSNGENIEENGIKYKCIYGFIDDKLSFEILISEKLDSNKKTFNKLRDNYTKMLSFENKPVKYEPAVTTVFGQRGGGFIISEMPKYYYELQIANEIKKRRILKDERKMISFIYIIDKNVLKIIRTDQGYKLITRSELVNMKHYIKK